MPKNDEETLPWWKNNSLKVGKLSAEVRKIRIVNTLTGQDNIISVKNRKGIFLRQKI